MSVKFNHTNKNAFYFVTCTCHDWLPLFEIAKGYELVYRWFHILRDQQIEISAFVIMPNHFHIILFLPELEIRLSKVIGNGKRFIAYDLLKRLEILQQYEILNKLSDSLTTRDYKKNQRHKVFQESFDAKEIYTERFFYQKLNYIHYNPIRGCWNLCDDYIQYVHSSASFYEDGTVLLFEPFDFRAL